VSDAREKMIKGAAQLLSRAGVSEASFGNVVTLTGAPRGSIYHHFPGGKDQLLSESVRHVGARLLMAMRQQDVDTAPDVILLFAGLFRRLLVDSGAGAGCAVAAVAVETPPATPPAEAAGTVFRSWISQLQTLFEKAGVDPAEAPDLAAATLAAVEGAMVLSRATGDVALFDAVVEQLVSRSTAS
jgi:TetR/AcrR family transcriptional repressor of lmrAB and yxaGH operons